MSNIQEFIGLLDDLKKEGPIDEVRLTAFVMRAAFEMLDPDNIEELLAEAEAWQIDEWNEADERNERNRRLHVQIVSTQGVAA